MVPFASPEEARAFQARGGGPAPGEVGINRATGVRTQAPMPTAPMVAEGTPEPVLTTPLNMTKNGRVMEMNPADVPRARELGWATATQEEVQGAREMRAAASPFGRGNILSEIGNELVAGTEALASGLIGSATSITNLVGATDGLSGHEVVAGVETAAMRLFGSQLTMEQQERKLRYRAEQNEIGAAVGEIASYVVLGAGAFKGAGMAAKALGGAETLGLGARVGVGAAEGFGTGAIAAREEAWVKDREITGMDILSQALCSALFGAALPLAAFGAGKAARTSARQLKKVFGGVKKLNPAALAGEAEAAAKRAGIDVDAIRADGETSKRLVSHRETLDSLGVDTRSYVADAAASSPDKYLAADKVIQEDLTRYYNAKFTNGKQVAHPGQSRPAIIQSANNRIQWADETTKKVDDLIAGSDIRVSADTLRARISGLADKGEWNVAKSRGGLASRRGPGWVATDPFDKISVALKRHKADLTGTELQSLRRDLISNAAIPGEDASAFASAAEALEELVKETLPKDAAKEFAEAMADKRVARKLAEGAKNQIKSLGSGGFDSIQESAAQFGVGVAQAPFHSLAGGAKQLKAVAQAVGRPMREYKLRRNAERFYQGQAAFAEAADSAILSAFTRTAKSVKYALTNLDFSKATGGVVPNSVGRAIVTGPAQYLNRQLYGDSADNDRHSATTLNNSYVRVRDMVIKSAGDMFPLVETINAKMGTADQHPMLTMEVSGGVALTMGYLQTALPKGTPQSPAMPMSPDLPPSETEMRVFMRKFEAVMNPWSVIEQLGQGTLSKESIDAVSTAYPGFYMRLSERVMRYLGSYPGRLPYDKACQMEIMLKSPGMLVPQNRPRFQATYTQVSKLVEANAAAGPPGGGGQAPQKGTGSSPTLAQQMRSPVNQAIDNIHN
jgi:hypothetical protein